MCNDNCQNDSQTITYEANNYLKHFFNQYIPVLFRGSFIDTDIAKMKSSLTNLYHVLLIENYKSSISAIFLHRLLTYILSIPVEMNINNHFISRLHTELNIVDEVSFFISQFTSTPYSSTIIQRYMNHMEGTDTYIQTGMFLSRINKPAVLDIMSIDINDVSLSELYYGITTGYFYYCEWASRAYDRLFEFIGNIGIINKDKIDEPFSFYTKLADEGNPLEIIKRLHSDGFIECLSRFVSITEP